METVEHAPEVFRDKNLTKESIENNVHVEIYEQPAPNKLRFRFDFSKSKELFYKSGFNRYETEGKFVRSLWGRRSEDGSRTYPSVRIHGFKVA